MKKLEAQQLVRTLAEAGSQRAAGRILGVTQSVVSDRLAQAREVLGDAAVDKVLGRARDAVRGQEAQQILKVLAGGKSQRAAAAELGVTQSVISERLAKARETLGDAAVAKALGQARATVGGVLAAKTLGKAAQGVAAARDTLADAVEAGDTEKVKQRLIEDENRRLRSQNNKLAESALDEEKVREMIFEIAHHKPKMPAWLKTPAKGHAKATGVPILVGSDWHWGEVVKPSEIGGVNEYNLEIARERLHQLIERAIVLLTRHMVKPDYPGIIFALIGDMVSGNIHEELCETNDQPIMPVVLDLIDHLIVAIKRLKEVFGCVFLPCVAGNHGRFHKKKRAKESNMSSFDWLIYQSLDRHFANDPDVVFFIPDGSDALVSVYGHRYLFTHGDQFRGGDGMIGALGPITRGDHKKRSRNAQVNQEYDTMVIGHFHQLIWHKRYIVNGSLIGYNEYAHVNNFGFEIPQQALWISNADHGITFHLPVKLGEPEARGADQQWVSWQGAKAA